MSFISLKNIEEKDILPGFKVKFIHSENCTFAYWEIKAGSVLPEHNNIHEQISQVTSGQFELTVENESRILKAGDVAIIPSNVTHSGKAITDVTITDVFYPIRKDYL